MPQRLFKKLFPAHKVRQHKYFNRFKHILDHPDLWHLNKHSAAKGCFVGIFCSFMPMPMQMFLAGAIALVVRSNLPVSVLLVWISNPLTYLPIFYFSYRIGLIFTGTSISYSDMSLDWELFKQIWDPLLLGSVINGIFFGLTAYIGIRIFWRWKILHARRKRNPSKQ